MTIGGLSVLDFANVPNYSTTFVVYKGWKERGKALSQDRIVAGLNRELSDIQEACLFVAIPPPIRGLGQTGGFQMMVEDRRSLGLAELQRNAAELVQAGNSNPSLRGLATTFSFRSPQLYLDIDRTKAESLQVPPGERVRDAPGLSGLVVRQLLQQLQPGLPGLHPGRQPPTVSSPTI